MLKDIDRLKVADFGVAMVPTENSVDVGEQHWECFLINLKEMPVHQVLVTSSGYKKSEEKDLKSSTLRYFFEKIEAGQAVLLELIPSELVQLTNEFWVSFHFEGHMYDKRYLFVEGSLDESLFTEVPVLQKKGVLIL
ncbi:MAG: hypothetical protein K9I85_02825 [Saprospiraceae bacterium]|nr:hypothetical protein [Saprospiraceae bacterium]